MPGRLSTLLTPVTLARGAFFVTAALLSLAVALAVVHGTSLSQIGETETPGPAAAGERGGQAGLPETGRRGAGTLYLPLVGAFDSPIPDLLTGTLRGTVQTIGVPSPILGSTQRSLVYLPPGYDTAERRYPALYLLHGADATERQWLELGLVDLADTWIDAGAIPPLIIVLPYGGNSYWVNRRDGGPRWADYIVQDLTGYIDRTYRTLPRAAGRAIGGLSMGGYGAVQIAFSHPEVFGVVGGHSPSLQTDDPVGLLAEIVGTGPEAQERDPVWLAARAPGLDSARIWLDAGDGDPYQDGVRELSQALADRGIAHELHIFPGGHDYAYWTINTATYLRFYAGALEAGGQSP